MELVIGILILLAICGSRAAKQGLTLLIGVPLGLVAAVMLIGMIGAGVSWFHTPAPPTPVARPSSLEPDDARNAESRIIELRQRYGAQAPSAP